MRKTPAKPKRIKFNAGDMHFLRGSLMARERRDISWQEFAEMLGIKYRYLAYVKSGERNGSGKRFVNGVLGLRERGLMVDLSDFTADRS